MRSKCNNSLRIIVAALALGGSCAAAIADEVTDRSQDPNLWAAPGGDQALTRHSSLKSINASNVRHLQMVWSQSSGTLRGHEGQPLVVVVNTNPMMYRESGWPNIIQALDLTDPDHPKEVWTYRKTSNRDESAVPRACCDTVNRGPSFAVGKGRPAVDGVAAGARYGRFVAIARLAVGPHFLRMIRIGQIQRLDDVRPAALPVHHRVGVDDDHQ